MIDYEKIPNRDRLLENVYTSLPTFQDPVVEMGIIPKVTVETESTVIPDLTNPLFEVDGKWVHGADVQTFYHSEGATQTLTATWFAVKDTIVPDEIKLKVAPEIQAATENQTLAGLKRMITLAKERQFHDLATNPANYATGFSMTPAVKWDAAGATIKDDIQAAITALNDKGVTVSAMIMPKIVWNRIKFAEDLLNVYVDRNYVTKSFMQDLFDIPKIVFPSLTTYKKPKKSSLVKATQLWTDDVILLGTDPLGAGTYPSFVEAVLEPALVQRLPMDPERLSQDIIAREGRGYNFLKRDAAYLIYDVLS